MNREHVKEIFKLLVNVYPQFEATTEKIDTWARLLKDQNPAVVMRNAEKFVLESKFPPTLADLRERNHEAYKTNVLDQIKEWEKNAARKQ
ncbi:replicative helicase loader/inhibitor [Bacillus sp. DTU_2020_1000418_1_SI_GHA_SEK_038]|uniref:replicative helicase loader/inhibitor n=1 Tax=Bacillus sp. DTU_2020_1000418_1_SI_GHA_SEK_038 TaxID=3077585 RepID=UPI0028E80827|nr:replicative helicase loader/inhibitor [Bacillus sp. DTU_2020_1000418_1_SI_GHA_SEK_038]WNS74263.1 replicative helicase loader/inhibitor [Bacillus sp. DTU_2020_1000418_1_SI_GHA_SEK_038]